MRTRSVTYRRDGHATRGSVLARIAVAILATVAFTAFRTPAPRPAHGPPPPEVVRAIAAVEAGETPVLRGKVISVIDGDSVAVQLQSGRIEVRLHAADAPEYAQPGGRAAARALRQRLPRGSDVVLEPVEQDQYDRLVGVIVHDGESLNAWLVQQGHAWAYRQYTADPRYCDWEDAARAAHSGLWSQPPRDWVAPWDWRRRAREPGYRPVDHSRETLDDCVASLRQSRLQQSRPCAIKGNVGKDGERVYHVPGSVSYDATRVDPNRGERWFCSEDEARRAGWRAPR